MKTMKKQQKYHDRQNKVYNKEKWHATRVELKFLYEGYWGRESWLGFFKKNYQLIWVNFKIKTIFNLENSMAIITRNTF